MATGDLLFHGFYPYIDSSPGGASLPNWIDALRALAERYPDAVFVSGHGTLASAKDLASFAGYLEALYDGVGRALERGLSEDAAVKSIDLSHWRMKPIPSFLKGKLIWATRGSNIRTVYRMRSEER